jgi:hypothetical protein
VPSAAEEAGCRSRSPAPKAMTAAATAPIATPQRRRATVENPRIGVISPQPRSVAPRAPAAGSCGAAGDA